MTTGPFIVTQTVTRGVDAPTGRVVYREAFATLGGEGGVREGIQLAVLTDDSTPQEASNLAHATLKIGADGGKLTLPNGDVIEVEAREWFDLLGAPGSGGNAADGRSIEDEQRWILAAWNAEHGIGIGPAASGETPWIVYEPETGSYWCANHTAPNPHGRARYTIWPHTARTSPTAPSAQPCDRCGATLASGIGIGERV